MSSGSSKNKRQLIRTLWVTENSGTREPSRSMDQYSRPQMRAAELLSELLLIGSRLQRTRNNEYYLVVPVVGGEIARKTPAKNSSSSILG